MSTVSGTVASLPLRLYAQTYPEAVSHRHGRSCYKVVSDQPGEALGVFLVDEEVGTPVE